MKLSDVDKLLALAKVEISEKEKEAVLHDLEAVLGYVNKIQEVITEEQKPEVPILKNVMREDVEPHRSGEFSEDILNEAPDQEDHYFKVKKIL